MRRFVGVTWVALVLFACGGGGGSFVPDVQVDESEPMDLVVEIIPEIEELAEDPDIMPDLVELVEPDIIEVVPDLCQPQCEGRECGPDGCGGTCGSCIATMLCLEEGVCVPPASTPATGDLVITEMMINPKAVSDDAGEWFEIRNTTGHSIALTGLQVTDEGSDGFVVESEIQVGPGKHFVFGRVAEIGLNGGVGVDHLWTQFELANTEDEIVLTFDGVLLDRVAWNADWTIPEGASLSLPPEQQTPETNNNPTDWCAANTPILSEAGDMGTPGAINLDCQGTVCEPNCTDKECGPDGCGGSCGSCMDAIPCVAGQCVTGGEPPQVGDLLVNELMVNPKASADDRGEYIEVWNHTAHKVLLSNLVVRDLETDSFTIEASLLVQPFGYVVLGRNTDVELNGGVEVDYLYGNKMTLANNADEVVLEWEGTVIDSVAYSNETWPVAEGASMVLDPWVADVELNDLPDAWCAATVPMPMGDRGSPGAENETCP